MMKGKAIITFGLILLCLIVSSLYCQQPVKAQYQGDITINPQGNISPATGLFQIEGNMYVLTGDLNGTITINANNIVLNGNGHTITVPSVFSSGITLDDVSDCIVANFTVIGGQYGINVYGTFNVVRDNSISSVNNGIYSLDEPTGGIKLTGTSNVLSGNTLTDNLVGINLFGNSPTANCSNNSIVGNTLTDCSTAVLLYDSSNNTFYHNYFIENEDDVYDSGLGIYSKVISLNIWDNGYPSGGNYWSDYLTKYPNAKMIDNSGLGDTAYAVETQNGR